MIDTINPGCWSTGVLEYWDGENATRHAPRAAPRCQHSITPLIAILSAVLLISTPGCRKKEFHIQEKFVNLYVELRLATLANQGNEKRAAEARRVILHSSGVKPEEFKKYMKEIEKRPEVWVEFQTRVMESINEMEKNYKGE